MSRMLRPMRRPMLRGALLLIAAGAMGCGGTSVDLPFEDSKKVEDLTSEDLKEVCTVGLEAFQEAYGEDICALQGIMASATGKGSCEEKRDSCLSTTFNPANCEGSEPEPLECDITVGELETCMNDTLALMDDMPSFSCSTTMEELMSLEKSDYTFSTPASCNAVNERCENIQMGLGGSSDDVSSSGSSSRQP